MRQTVVLRMARIESRTRSSSLVERNMIEVERTAYSVDIRMHDSDWNFVMGLSEMTY